MNIVAIDTVKPVVKTVTVTLSKAEIIDLTSAYERYYGAATFTKNLKAAANGDVTAPATLTNF